MVFWEDAARKLTKSFLSNRSAIRWKSETSAPTQSFDATPVAGKHGKRSTFNFRYRSHRLRDENITLNTQIDEVKDIRAKLAAFGGGGSSDQMKPFKREYVEEEGCGTGLGSQSTPASQKVKRQKTHDLTGDD
ncbi:hypothetical protein MMC08_002416 [Hypocenomyce scalaris]|nr:hypothetical protein [Hypocenomyce scalaris]